MTSSLKNPAEQLEEDTGPRRERAELRSACFYALSGCCLKGQFTQITQRHISFTSSGTVSTNADSSGF